MSFQAPIVQRVEKDVCIRIHRSLRGKGTISVAKGQQVSPADIIGTSFISSGFRTVQLSEQLGVVPSEVGKYMKRSLGQKIFKDELLAEKSDGLFGGKKIITSPTDGILDFLSPQTGELRMTFLPKKQDLPAGVFGIIDGIDKQRGQVIIRTLVTILHGRFGTGRVRDGILHIISKRDELVGKDFISDKLDGEILAGGSLVFKEAITSAISGGVSGIITGGINAKDYKGMAGGRLVFPKKLDNDIGISIVVCEGFGSIPIGLDIYDVLSKYDGKFVSIDGNAGVIRLPSFESSSMKKVAATNLPPVGDDGLTSYNKQENQVMDIKLGCLVRIVGNSYLGEQGKIIAIDQTATVMSSGLKAHMATIETKRRKIQVPVENLEIID